MLLSSVSLYVSVCIWTVVFGFKTKLKPVNFILTI